MICPFKSNEMTKIFVHSIDSFHHQIFFLFIDYFLINENLSMNIHSNYFPSLLFSFTSNFDETKQFESQMHFDSKRREEKRKEKQTKKRKEKRKTCRMLNVECRISMRIGDKIISVEIVSLICLDVVNTFSRSLFGFDC